MKYTALLLLSVACGAVAFFLNQSYLNSQIQTYEYACAAFDIEEGQEFTKESFKPIRLNFAANQLVELPAVPFSELPTIYGLRAFRPLKKGDLILWQDVRPTKHETVHLRDGYVGLYLRVDDLRILRRLLKVGQSVSFAVPAPRDDERSTDDKQDFSAFGQSSAENFRKVGPFRVVGVDEKVIDLTPSVDDFVDDKYISTLTLEVAYSEGFDEATNLLIRAYKSQQIAAVIFDVSVESQ